MAMFTGAQKVKGGYYLNVHDLKIEVVEGESGTLPGGETARYRRIPVILMLVLAPLMGLAFVMLLPFVGIAVLVEQFWRKAHAALAARRAPLPKVRRVARLR